MPVKSANQYTKPVNRMVGRLFRCAFAGAGELLGGAHEKKQDDTGAAALGAVPAFFLRAGAAGYRCGPVLWHNT